MNFKKEKLPFLNEFEEKVRRLMWYDNDIVNDIFSCYKCLIVYNVFTTEYQKGNIIGSSGFIDQITINHMNNRIEIGHDKYYRPFIAICCQNEKKEQNVIVLFQRYTDTKREWSLGSCYKMALTENKPFIDSTFLNDRGGEKSRNCIRNIIEEKPFEIEVWDSNKRKRVICSYFYTTSVPKKIEQGFFRKTLLHFLDTFIF